MRSLARVGHLVADKQAELEADVVRGEHVLTGHEQRRLAEVLQACREEATPTNVSSRAECLDELALVIEQAGVTFRHDVNVADLPGLQERYRNNEHRRYDDEKCKTVVHVSSFRCSGGL